MDYKKSKDNNDSKNTTKNYDSIRQEKQTAKKKDRKKFTKPQALIPTVAEPQTIKSMERQQTRRVEIEVDKIPPY